MVMTGRFKLAALLIRPSLLSASLSLLFAALVLGREGWAHANHRPELYDMLARNFGLSTLPSTEASGPSVLSNLLSNGVAYQVLLILCAIGVGLLVYALLRGIGGFAKESSEVIAELRSHGVPHHLTASAPVTRFILRLTSFVAWAIYAAVFINVLVPFSVMLVQDGLDRFVNSPVTGVMYAVSSVLLLALCTHLHAVFARICFLRLRIFGGIDTTLYVSSNK
jgi:hypothetical protein